MAIHYCAYLLPSVISRIMRLVTIAVVLVLSSLSSFCQSRLSGKWYCISGNALMVLEYDFGKNSISASRYDWEMHHIENSVSVSQVIKVVNRIDRTYYLLKIKESGRQFTVNEFATISAGILYTQPLLPASHTYFDDEKSALAFIENDTLKRPGLAFYSYIRFNQLAKLPNAKKIKKQEFIDYLKSLIKATNEDLGFFKEHKEEASLALLMFYLPSKAREILADKGYNPMISDEELANLSDKFKEDTEIMALKRELDQVFMPDQPPQH